MIESTVQWLAFVVVSFLSIGVMEALVKPLAKSFFKRKVVKYAPIAMQLLDERIPRALASGDDRSIEDMLITRLESLTGESWSKSEINEFFSLYDPRITVNKLRANNG
jgi:hypothetical protein